MIIKCLDGSIIEKKIIKMPNYTEAQKTACKKYYDKNRALVCERRRLEYEAKNAKKSFFKLVKLIGMGKQHSKQIIKTALDAGEIQISLDDDVIPLKNFMELYKINDAYAVVEVDYLVNDDNVLILKMFRHQLI
jgi:hypothetical protein